MIHARSLIETLDKARTHEGNTTWNISRETGVFLHSLILAKQAKRVLEIGTSTGYSALWIIDALSHTGGKLTTIESHKERYALANNHFTEAGATDIVTAVLGHAPEILESIPGTFDLVFLDATKEEHVSYATALIDRLEWYGMIIADNMISHEKDLALYRTYMESQSTMQHSLIPIGSGLLVSIKIPPQPMA